MVNTSLFNTSNGPNTVNKAGGSAYALSNEAALAQLVCTGTFRDTFYSSAQDLLAEPLKLARVVDVTFLAKAAVYARNNAYMKDSPAVLMAVLSQRDSKLFAQVFPRVINTPKMIRNFVQVMRSGTTGRKSLGSGPKRQIQRWLANQSDASLFYASVGNSPSLADIIKMVHPKPSDERRQALYDYLLNKKVSDNLPPIIKEYEAFKADVTKPMPDVDFQLLTALPLTDDHWKQLALRSSWTQTRMNLNTFARHNVFSKPEVTKEIAAKLADKQAVLKSKCFPYQLMTTYYNLSGVPAELTFALQKALDYSVENVPEISGNLVILVDSSGSMQSPITGYASGSGKTSATTCTQAAALIAAAFVRKNPMASVALFDTTTARVSFNPMDSVVTNAKLFNRSGGGTDCEQALRFVANNYTPDYVLMISDNESWAHGRSTSSAWRSILKKNPNCKLINLDLEASATTQVASSNNVLNLGGFSDDVFNVIATFFTSGSKDHWVDSIREITL